MKKILLSLLFMGMTAILFAQGGWTKPNNSHGTIQNGISADSAMSQPTGCGDPGSRYSLPIRKSNYYFDSCAHRQWVYDPALDIWDSIHVGIAGGGSGFNIYNHSDTVINNEARVVKVHGDGESNTSLKFDVMAEDISIPFGTYLLMEANSADGSKITIAGITEGVGADGDELNQYKFEFTRSDAIFNDRRSIQTGIVYGGNYNGTLTDSSLITKAFGDSAYGVGSGPGGIDRSLQFNDASSFGGAGIRYDLISGEGTFETLSTYDATVTDESAHAMHLQTGVGNGSGFGGYMLLTSGNGGATGNGGSMGFVTGNGGASSGDGGQLSISTGVGTAGNATGGDIGINAGSSHGVSAGGSLNMSAGQGGETGQGGGITLTGGTGGATSGDGGYLHLSAGNSAASGNGGDVVLTPGSGAGAGVSGNVILNGLKFPLTDGSAGQVINTNGTGTLAWTTITGSFTETVERFTGATSLTVTVANTPLTAKARMVFFNGVFVDPSSVSIAGTGFTLSGITRTSSDIITVKYSY